MKKFLSILLTAALTLSLCACGSSEPAPSAENEGGDTGLNFPTKNLTVVVPYNAGGSSDLSCRAIMSKLSDIIGQPVMVDNIAGANGLTGTNTVVDSAADGYTLAWLSSRTNLPEMYSSTAPYTSADLRTVSNGVVTPGAIAVKADSPIQTFDDLIEYIKANPGVKYGHAGRGNNTHISAVLLSQTYDLNTVDVPYEGDTNAALALLRGDVEYVFCAANTLMQHVESGDVRMLAIQAENRIEICPDIPTMNETSYPIPNIASYIGLFAPAGTPDEVVKYLDECMAKCMEDEELIKTLIDLGFEVTYKNAEEFQTEVVDVFYDNVAPLIKEAGLYEG